MITCSLHDWVQYPEGGGCWKCSEDAVRQADERHWATIRAIERAGEEQASAAHAAADMRVDFGDYECPACLYLTLRRTATRCPMCHAAIDASYWTPILEEERQVEAARVAEIARAEAMRAAEAVRLAENARAETERVAEEVRRATQKTKEEILAKKKEDAWSLRKSRYRAVFYAVYLLPALALVAAIGFSVALYPDRAVPMQVYGIALIPGLNWILCVSFMLEPMPHLERWFMTEQLAYWGALGIFAIRPRASAAQRRRRRSGLIYFGYLIPLLGLATAMGIDGLVNGAKYKSANWIASLVPGYNWDVCTRFVTQQLNPNLHMYLIGSLIAWTAVGFCVWQMSRPLPPQ